MRPIPTLKISISGVRGVIGESLTPTLLTRFAQAFGTYIGARTHMDRIYKIYMIHQRVGIRLRVYKRTHFSFPHRVNLVNPVPE